MARVVEQSEVAGWRTDLLREEVRTAFGFLEKLNALPEEIGPEDVRALRDAGLSDEAIRDAIYVCASFNVIGLWSKLSSKLFSGSSTTTVRVTTVPSASSTRTGTRIRKPGETPVWRTFRTTPFP